MAVEGVEEAFPPSDRKPRNPFPGRLLLSISQPCTSALLLSFRGSLSQDYPQIDDIDFDSEAFRRQPLHG